MIELQDINKSYKMGETLVHALRGVSLQIQEGEFVAIMGPSGSGKSTLMHILGLLDIPTSGSFQLHGQEVSQLSEDDLAVLRREEIGFIFQQFNLLPRLSAAENVSLPLLYTEKHFDLERATELLKTVGLESRAGHRPNELSGGQQQRVAIARSLMNRPKIIFADEPTGNLDSVSEREILKTLEDLNAQGITIILVTHEEEIGRKARRLIRMRDGLIQSDERHEVQSAGPPPTSVSKATPLAVIQSAGAPAPHPSKVAGLFKWLEFIEHLRQGYRTLVANKVRTALSMLGILIGVAAVVTMLAVGRGASRAIEAQLTSLGSNLLVLRSGGIRVAGIAQDAGSMARLTPDDAIAIANQVPQVKETGPSVSGRAQVTYLNKNWSTQVQGTMPSFARIRASQPEIGRFFTEEENRSRARIAVIGMTLVRELFGTQNPLGEFIKINKVSFQVVGVLPEKGSNGFRDQDDTLVIPLATAMYRLLGKTTVDSIDIEARDASELARVQSEVEALMLRRHRVPPSQQDTAFQVRNMAELQSALSESSKTFSVLLASIAAISLLVGGIGIMNIMLVSVTERTREIGLRKAIGARRADILLQFLAESIVVSVVGGLAGIALGVGSASILSITTGWATSVSPESILLAFLFSSFIGIFFGIYPARRASLLHPIEALRHD
jgi:macrolide transport system ATP-binding/permease protein